MPLYLIHVHPKPANATVPVAQRIHEFEVNSRTLTEACLAVIDAPMNLKGTTLRRTEHPYLGTYVEPEAGKYAAVAHVSEGKRDRVRDYVTTAGVDYDAERISRARHLGTSHGRSAAEATNLADMLTLDRSWEDLSADHAGKLRAYVENEWYDEEVEGRSWFHEMEARLRTVGLDQEDAISAAVSAYWQEVHDLAARLNDERPVAPTP